MKCIKLHTVVFNKQSAFTVYFQYRTVVHIVDKNYTFIVVQIMLDRLKVLRVCKVPGNQVTEE